MLLHFAQFRKGNPVQTPSSHVSHPSLQHIAAIVAAASRRDLARGSSSGRAAVTAEWFVVYTGHEQHVNHDAKQLQQPSFETAGDFAVSLSPRSRHMPARALSGSGGGGGAGAASAIADYINSQHCR